jgi:dolichol kinase
MDTTGGVENPIRPFKSRVARTVAFVLVTALLCYIALGAAGAVVGLIASD